MGILSNLEPKPVFHYFEEICAIPHGSSNTKAISDYCVEFAKAHSLRYIQDNSDNVIIFKDGTAGYEQSAPVILQGHLDMVCEKDSDCYIDFSKDGLTLQLQGNTITANGTTLGADDGIAVAYALAILDSEDIPHPPLEVIFTSDEEMGMLGAAALDCSPLRSRTMLNMDSEEEGYLLVSCAGGIRVNATLPLKREEASGLVVDIKLSGLTGGHSGVEIDKGRANACKLLGRTLYRLYNDLPFGIISIDGGLMDNAIPRDASAQILLSKDKNLSDPENTVRELNEVYKREYQLTDSNIKLDICNKKPAASVSVMTSATTEAIITALVSLPNGIQRMSGDIKDLVQTSLNLGILSSTDTEVVYSFAVRSSVESEKEELVERIKCLIEALGGTISCSGDYPAWEYRKDSPLRELMIKIYEEQYGNKPIVQAIHAGVECGILSGKLAGLDCVSFGPDIKGAHTPKESLSAESALRTWKYLLEILKRLK
ncbi:MAG: aminoacyl-histidine dipeptidase [Lachnospiraceae bacterium]|nr:aminoacyl-histidine dipeptidase [Lachnospiraceae bacterium]